MHAYIHTYFSQVPYIFQFFACLLIIFGAEVAAGVFGFLNKDKVRLLSYSLSSTVSVVTSNDNTSLIFFFLSYTDYRRRSELLRNNIQ